jgi:methylase of polypeptide subunit release factors
MKMEKLKLSNQALGAVMMALQNSLITQTDIVPVLKGFELFVSPDGELIVSNPPSVRAKLPEEDEESPVFVSE